MEIFLNRKTRNSIIKAVSVLTGIATILSLSGFMYFTADYASAVVPSDYSLKEGDTISAAGSSDPDVYIVNAMGYKRLFLNPVIFGFYGHLGGFAKVKNVSSATRDAFGTSGLFRNCETVGDQKVYGLETTGEDTGKLHWVNTTGDQAVKDDANFFKKVFCINSKEANWYDKGSDYTSVSQIPNYSRVAVGGVTPTPTPSTSVTPTPSTTPATGTLSVSLASDNPAARTVTTNAQAVELMKINFSGNGTVTQMVFKRGGPGATGDFTNLYIYDGAIRLTSGKSLSSSDGSATFIGLNVAVSGSKVLTLVGTLAGTAGNVDSFTLNSVNGSVATAGLPLMSNNLTFAGATSGGITIAKAGSLGNPNVGQKQALLAEFKITANTEAASLKRLTLLNGGTLKTSDFSNVKLTQGTNSWPGTVISDGHLVFDLGTGFTIVKGGNSTFDVWGDLGGKSTDTVKLYFEDASDTWAIGDQYGYTMATTNTTINTAALAHALTLQGGTLTLNFNGPNATTIGTTTTGTVLFRYTMLAQNNIEVRKTKWDLCADTGNTGTYVASTNAAGWTKLTSFQVVDEDSGSTVMGPQDGSAFTNTGTAICPNAVNGAEKTFTDSFNLTAGKPLNLKVLANINTGTAGGFTIASGDAIKVVLGDYSAAVTSSGDLTVMRYAGTSNAVVSTDIVPTAAITGNTFAISASSLTLGLSSTPASRTVIKGTKNVDVVGITFAANQASDLKITDITITGYASDNTTTFAAGTDVTDTGVSVANAMGNIRLVEAESGNVVADSSKMNSNNLSVQNTGTARFSFASTPWLIPAGATRTMLVRSDLSSNAASGTAGDAYAFDIAATANITALDSSNNTLNAANQRPNGTTSPTRKLTIKNAGTVVMSTHPDAPIKGGIFWGQVDAPISKFNLTATNEGFFIENLTIAASTALDATYAAGNVKQVKLTYTNKIGNTLTTVQSFTNGASANFGWSCSAPVCVSAGDTTDTRPYIPKDGSLAVAVAASMRTAGESASPTNAAPIVTGNGTPNFSLDLVDKYNGSYSTGLRLVGDGSGSVINGGSSGIADVLGSNKQYLYRSFPKIDQVALPSPYTFTGTPTVFKFSVTAMGLPDSKLRFDNTNFASGSMYFAVVSSGESGATTSTTYTIYDENNVLIDASSALRMSSVSGSPNAGQNFVANSDLPALKASIIFDFTTKTVEIAGGSTKTFRIQIDNPNTNYNKTSATGRAADYFQVQMLDNNHQLINWVANYDGTANSIKTGSLTGVLRNLPMYGPTFTR